MRKKMLSLFAVVILALGSSASFAFLEESKVTTEAVCCCSACTCEVCTTCCSNSCCDTDRSCCDEQLACCCE